MVASGCMHCAATKTAEYIITAGAKKKEMFAIAQVFSWVRADQNIYLLYPTSSPFFSSYLAEKKSMNEMKATRPPRNHLLSCFFRTAAKPD